MGRLEVTNPEPAQGSQRPALRRSGAEVLRLIGYPVVRKVLADLGWRLNMPETAVPIAVDDVVDALRAHLPLLELPAGLEGVCEFVVVGDPGRRNGVALAWAEVAHGRVVASGSVRLGLGRRPRSAQLRRGRLDPLARRVDFRRAGQIRIR